MRFVLDSNEYLFAFGVSKNPASAALLDALVTHPETHTIRAPRLIVDEIRRNLPGDIFREVFTLIRSLIEVDVKGKCRKDKLRTFLAHAATGGR